MCNDGNFKIFKKLDLAIVVGPLIPPSGPTLGFLKSKTLRRRCGAMPKNVRQKYGHQKSLKGDLRPIFTF